MNTIKACCVGVLLGIMPLLGFARVKVHGSTLSNSYTFTETLVDSVPRGPRQDDKGKKSKKRPKEGEEVDAKIPDVKRPEPEIKRPDIKEVPRAKPKLRPGIVGDRIKIKRPPVKIGGPRGRGLGGALGI